MLQDDDQIAALAEWVRESKKIVFFGGAGVSTESGIPDFRSQDGLYHMKYDVPPERILSAGYFREHTQAFYEFYRDKMLFPAAEPNITHRTLARWEREGRLLAVVTQNIDGLHQLAGSRNVCELHGSVLRNRCLKCGERYGLDTIRSTTGIPRCVSCGGVIKPEVVLYGEPLDEAVIQRALQAISQAELMIVAGTSLTVYPAAGFIEYFRGKHLVLINRDATPYDDRCELVIRKSIGEVFQRL